MIALLFTLASFFFQPSTTPTETIGTKDLDFSGHWEGTITQDYEDKRIIYNMEVDITQSGKTVKGKSFVHHKQYAAEMEFTGKFKKNYLQYQETKILKSDSIPLADWCLKYVDLRYSEPKGIPTLEGVWQGYASNLSVVCDPGRIFLTKKPTRV